MTSTHDVPNDSQPHHNHDRLLAESIVAATRGIHAKLNKLIIARLPLALPPRAQDPALYISGLLHITPIYMTFEALWRDILDSPVNDVDKKETNPHDPDTGLPEATSPASDTPEDGEDLKREFKQRLLDAEKMLTTREKQDIVQESVCIFENMTLLIHQLDSVCGDPERKDSSSTTSSLFELVDQFHPFRSRIRDSVSITKERNARTSTLSSDGVRQVWKSWVNTSASSPPQGEFVAPTGHPDVSRADSGAASCPASKSMRFEKALPKPTRTPSDLAKTKHGLQECLKLASQRLQSMHVINWLMLAAFCALTYGALFSARRGEDMALDA
ncbi:hypothetical protein NW755_007274 [Fusarium falciforme]|uniref:Uncharacterized protein n=1 Tax=Fusarium falciforme TaxID=195108 RepID=A0A9W8UZE8_9HYPO|nr:hypothetical protein NW755_007274 [Fusarium falciforme]